ncbi:MULTISPECIES: phosphatase PAP2 family protein [unclassified Streptomyces]|uniref:phosphatase PAP2 family protein n=1 Tax=unclassified Streptomyces TaxID=2593676 RepID=UPI00225AF5B1|nr:MULTISPECIES: phosphatase PAP2 family protein [unclassified Streptomyces]MCX5051403.1 phosphatase PAP2 family protein [Streptomyces sp. NBC_00474]MCX5249295.1 phosphatase PAP2 family protein [Streptomyces sp. NBC_00201]
MGDIRTGPPQLRPGRALAHTHGASGSGSPHRSDSRPPQTPRGGRRSDLIGRPGTTPPVPGRPASFLLLLGLPALLFALITWQVVSDGLLLRVDRRVSLALTHPDRFSGGLSDLGNVEVAVPVLAVVLAYVAWRGRASGMYRWWLPPLAAALVMALVPALIVPLKALVDRPSTPLMPPSTGYYPSGHTATSAVAYGSATLLLLPWLRTAYARRTLVAACAVVTLAVGFGLVRRGYHWPLDVVASWCLCTVLLTSLWIFLVRVGSTGGRRESTTEDE